jgi:D-arabinose 5-phosphate isomerase GutQ
VTDAHVDVVVQSIDVLRSVLEQQSLLPTDWLIWFRCDNIVLTGVGKSFNVAQLGASLFQSVGMPAQAIHATDLLHGSFGVFSPGDVVTLILLSHSGRTTEILNVKAHVRRLREHGRIIRTVAITSLLPDNVLATQAQHVLRYVCERDGSSHGTIPSVSTTAQLAWLNSIACAEASYRSANELALNHPLGHLASVYERMSGE